MTTLNCCTTSCNPEECSAAANGEPCRNQIQTFINRWFAHAGNQLGEIRCVDRIGSRKAPRDWFARSSNAIDFVCACAASHFDVYLGAQPRWRMGGEAVDINRLVFACADIDVGSIGHASPSSYPSLEAAIAAVRTLPFEPSMIVGTGGGLQVWFALTADGASVAEWSEGTSRLVSALGADRAATGIAQILRVPGTGNHKAGLVRPVRLLATSEARVPIARLLELPAHAPTSIAPAGPSPTPTTSAKTASPLTLAAARPPLQRGQRPFDRANAVAIGDVLRALGVTSIHAVGTRLYCACPVCPGDDVREMVVGGRKNIATCFGDCAAERGAPRAFTPVDIVVATLRCSPMAAVNFIAERFGFLGFTTGGRA